MAGEYAESLRGAGSSSNPAPISNPAPAVKKKKKKKTAGTVVTPPVVTTAEPTVVAEPTLTEAERNAKAEADAKAAAAAEKLETSKNVFNRAIKVFFPGAENDAWINDLFESAKSYLDQGFEDGVILDMMLQDGKTPEKFNQRFSGIFKLDQRRDAGETVYVPTIAEYMTGEEEYTRLVTKLGMSNLATAENYGTIVGNDVSIDEVRDRIANATARVNALDEATLKQLKVEFPNMTQADLVQSILNKETPKDFEARINRAEIGVEANQAGIVSRIGTQALAEAGITRTQARTGFQALAEYNRTAGAGIQQAQGMFGDTTNAEDLQTELEKEALLGQTSKTRKRLESQARAQFAGQSGITTGSLKRKAQV